MNKDELKANEKIVMDTFDSADWILSEEECKILNHHQNIIIDESFVKSPSKDECKHTKKMVSCFWCGKILCHLSTVRSAIEAQAKSEERQRILKIIEPIRQDLSDLIDKLYCGEKKEVSEETFDILVKIHDKIELLSKFIEV